MRNSCLFRLPESKIFSQSVPSQILISLGCKINTISYSKPGLCSRCREGNVIGKVHSTTGHEVPEWEEIYISTVSLTSELDGGGWSTPSLDLFSAGKHPIPIV